MFSRSPVCLCGLVKKVVTCWERHSCFVVFSKTHFQQNGFKRGETAKYLQVTRQSWPMLSRGCTCPETFEELHLHASDCLHLSFFMSLFLKPSHFCLSEYMGSSFLYPPLYIFFALPMERNAHCSIFAGKDQKLWEEEPPSPEKGQLAVVSVPPKSTTDFGTLPWISPNLRFGGKSISAGCLAAQESKPMVEAR